MNPRVSRSSALASKATGFPIAKIAAKLAVGYTLDELRNDITRETPASFEPAIDYCVVKFPRWAFEKFPEADQTLTTQMKSVGEVMAIGRTFKEALQKAVRSLEQDRWGLALDRPARRPRGAAPEDPHPDAPSAASPWPRATGAGSSTRGDPRAVRDRPVVPREHPRDRRASSRRSRAAGARRRRRPPPRQADGLRRPPPRRAVRARPRPRCGAARLAAGIRATFKMVDTCAAEFAAHTPVPLLDLRGGGRGARAPPRDKVVILGSGPNRIGQGIEFDYACVHAAFALREAGVEAIMVNCNPETVSTDYDTSDRLYFEPLTFEDVMNIVERERPRGVIVQFGGQTPLKLTVAAQRGRRADPRHAARRHRPRRGPPALRRRCSNDLGLHQAPGATARSFEEAARHRRRHRLPRARAPVLRARRPRHADRLRRGRPPRLHDRGGAREPGAPHPRRQVPRGRARDRRGRHRRRRARGGGRGHGARGEGGHPLRRLRLRAAALLARRRPGRAHQGRRRAPSPASSAWSASSTSSSRSRTSTVFVLEVNPRASRTVPFVSKAIGVPLAKLATKVMLGRRLRRARLRRGAGARAHRDQGGGVPVREVPRGRRACSARR